MRRWLAPEWWGFWPDAQMTGLFREHPAGVFLLPAALGPLRHSRGAGRVRRGPRGRAASACCCSAGSLHVLTTAIGCARRAGAAAAHAGRVHLPDSCESRIPDARLSARRATGPRRDRATPIVRVGHGAHRDRIHGRPVHQRCVRRAGAARRGGLDADQPDPDAGCPRAPGCGERHRPGRDGRRRGVVRRGVSGRDDGDVLGAVLATPTGAAHDRDATRRRVHARQPSGVLCEPADLAPGAVDVCADRGRVAAARQIRRRGGARRRSPRGADCSSRSALPRLAILVLSPPSRFAERYAFSPSYIVAGAAVVVALRLWPRLASGIGALDQRVRRSPHSSGWRWPCSASSSARCCRDSDAGDHFRGNRIDPGLVPRK